MIKGIMIYTILLMLIDLMANLLINFIQHNPGAVILVTVILRIVLLLILFPLIGLFFSYFVFNNKNIKTSIIIT